MKLTPFCRWAQVCRQNIPLPSWFWHLPTTVVDVDQRRQGRGQKPDTTVTNPHQHTQRLIILIRDLSKMFSLTNSGELEALPRLSNPKLTGDDKSERSDKERKIDSPEGEKQWTGCRRRHRPLVPVRHCATAPPWSQCNLHYATNPHCLNVSICFIPDDVENAQNTTEESKHFASAGHRELWINPAAFRLSLLQYQDSNPWPPGQD